jgi:hypothetical protein
MMHVGDVYNTCDPIIEDNPDTGVQSLEEAKKNAWKRLTNTCGHSPPKLKVLLRA